MQNIPVAFPPIINNGIMFMIELISYNDFPLFYLIIGIRLYYDAKKHAMYVHYSYFRQNTVYIQSLPKFIYRSTIDKTNKILFPNNCHVYIAR